MALPDPESRTEFFLARIAGQNVAIPIPESRLELFLAYIAEHGSGGASFEAKIVEQLPETGENGIIYLVPHQGGVAPNIYDEYLWIASTSSFETIGSTQIDLTDYVKNTDYATANNAGIIKTSVSYGTVGSSTSGMLTASTRTYEQYTSGSDAVFIGKGTLENVIAGKGLISTPTIVTSVTSNTLVLGNNQEARLGTLSTLILAMPDTIGDIYESNLNFASGATATTLTYSATPIIWTGDDCDAEGDFTPSANTSYEISIKKLGTDIVARVGAY